MATEQSAMSVVIFKVFNIKANSLISFSSDLNALNTLLQPLTMLGVSSSTRLFLFYVLCIWLELVTCL